MFSLTTLPSVGRMAAASAAFLSVANAHMHIAEPKPLQGYSPKDPLEQSGSNWPCHGAPLPTSGGQKMVAGENFDLKLDLGGGANTAVHGGGSCQLAILYDTAKAADPSNWHVIYSIEGGCPANAQGNLASAEACTSDGQGECVHSWSIPMPKGVDSGNAILSWTWFNTVGNREMYQNCVNIDITGGTGDEMGSFPHIFTANIGDKGECGTTTENFDVGFGDFAGKYTTSMSATAAHNWPLKTAACSANAGGSKPTGYGSDSGPTSEAAASTTAAETQSQYAPSVTSIPAYSAPVATSAPAQQIESYQAQRQKQPHTTFATSASVAPSSSVAAAEPTGYSSGSSNGQSNATSSDDCEPCTDSGSLVCIGEDSFGICDSNTGCAVARPLAAGTVCRDGVIAGKTRFARHAIHGHGHAHKH